MSGGRAPFRRGQIYELMLIHQSLTPRECARLLGAEVGPVGHCMTRMVPKWLRATGRHARRVYHLVPGAPPPVDGRGEVKPPRPGGPRVQEPIAWQWARTLLEECWPEVAGGNVGEED